MSTNSTNFTINVRTTPELTKAIADYQENLPGAEEELRARISQVVERRNFSLVEDNNSLLEKEVTDWKIIATLTSFCAVGISIIAYSFGWNRGSQNMFDQISKEPKRFERRL